MKDLFSMDSMDIQLSDLSISFREKTGEYVVKVAMNPATMKAVMANCSMNSIWSNMPTFPGDEPQQGRVSSIAGLNVIVDNRVPEGMAFFIGDRGSGDMCALRFDATHRDMQDEKAAKMLSDIHAKALAEKIMADWDKEDEQF